MIETEYPSMVVYIRETLEDFFTTKRSSDTEEERDRERVRAIQKTDAWFDLDSRYRVTALLAAAEITWDEYVLRHWLSTPLGASAHGFNDQLSWNLPSRYRRAD